MGVTLREYQLRDLDALRAELRQHQSCLYVAPCGSGKGTIISYIVNACVERQKRVIFAVHGKALVHDMSERVTRLGIRHGVLMGSHRRERWHPVQVASIDTLHRLPHPPQADVIIADEAHLSLSPTWRKTLERYPAAKIIGCTATPIRLDRQGLGRESGGLFDSMVLGPTEQDLIDLGYLVPSRVLAPPPPADLANVKKTAGEYNSAAQAAICDKAKVIGDIVEHWRKHAADRKTAAFGVDRAHANHIAEQFRCAGVNWAYVDADTPDVERARIWRDLDDPRNDLMGVASVGCISIGWDHAIVSCLIAARKTASLGLWRQMLGRGSRINAGKKNFLVLDHVGNTHHHEPWGMFEDQVEWSLNGQAVREPDGKRAASVTTCKRAAMVDGVVKLPCYATFKTGPTECPYCGLPLVSRAREVVQVKGELEEIKRRDPIVREKNERIIREVYDALQRTQAEKGYKAGYAGVVFKERFGFWPPKEWKAGTRAVAASVPPAPKQEGFEDFI